MKRQFVTYDIALQLKKLGFDKPCLAYFESVYNGLTQKYTGKLVLGNKPEHLQSYKQLVYIFGRDTQLAPLWQQVIDWFREKHDIHIVITPYNDEEANQILYDFTIFQKDWNDLSDYTYYHTLNEVREQSILKCIELCQKEK